MQALSMYHDCSIRHKLLTVMMTITVALFECAQNGRWKNTFFFYLSLLVKCRMEEWQMQETKPNSREYYLFLILTRNISSPRYLADPKLHSFYAPKLGLSIQQSNANRFSNQLLGGKCARTQVYQVVETD